MEGDVTQLSDDELRERISDLEHTYAECLKDGMDRHTMLQVWRRIIELRSELHQRDAQ